MFQQQFGLVSTVLNLVVAGYPATKIVSKPFVNLLAAPDDANLLKLDLQSSQESQDWHRHDIYWKTAEGDRWITCSSNAVINRQGQLDYIITGIDASDVNSSCHAKD